MIWPRSRLLILIPIAAALLVAFAPQIRVAYLTVLLLAELPSPRVDGPIAARLPAPGVERVAYEAAGRTMIADVYSPARGGVGGARRRPGIVLNHGVATGGMDDARLVNFADALARCGYVVLVPEFINLKEFRVRPTDVDEVVASFGYLAGLPGVDPDRVGLFGFSYAGGLAILAANDPAIAGKVKFVFALGTYYDLRDIIIYATTGYYRDSGKWVYMAPRHTGKWAFTKNMLGLVNDAHDRELLARIADAKLEDAASDVSLDAAALGEEGRQVYTLMTNTDPDKAVGLIDGLNENILAYLDALSLPGNMDNVRADLILAHGRDDNLMPYTESVKLAENAPPAARVRLRILKSFQHVDLDLTWEGGPREWVATTAEAGRVFSVGYALLAEGLL
jgi:acetyl esterase/lipase